MTLYKELSVEEMINEFVITLPKIDARFGYGSGVFKQAIATKNNQIDLILAVEDPTKWHKDNMRLNPYMYSTTGKAFFSEFARSFYEYGTGACYIPFIPFTCSNGETVMFKIGVIKSETLIKNNISWDNFYIPGRGQKVNSMQTDSEIIKKSAEYNRLSALIVSLIMLNEKVAQTKKDLLFKITSLSYIGDSRSFLEGNDKIMSLVDGSYNELSEIYRNDYFYKTVDNKLEINYKAIDEYGLDNLPSELLRRVDFYKNISAMNEAELIVLRKKLNDFFWQMNKENSIKQTIKGVFTAGPVKSLKYVGEKKEKADIRKKAQLKSFAK